MSANERIPPSAAQPAGPRRGPVAIASCKAVAGTEEDDLRVIDALGRRGVDAVHAAWDDPGVDWPSFQLAVVRSTWDYPDRRDEFLAWAARLRRVLNPLSILRWNTDKRYLDDLARAGLPVIPTRFLQPGDVFEPPPWPFVVKPAVSCGAKATARYRAGDGTGAGGHVRRLQAGGRTVMIQPYQSAIEAEGETAVLFIGGAYSHSIRRGALLKEIGQTPKAEMTPLGVRAHRATAAERSLAEKALSAVPGGPSELLYARVDLAPGPAGQPLLLELELTEPSLFLGFGEGSAERLADGIAAALARR
jgi:glutathione synthase/RimK-type ligase-like ATP-grasp enzyme